MTIGAIADRSDIVSDILCEQANDPEHLEPQMSDMNLTRVSVTNAEGLDPRGSIFIDPTAHEDMDEWHRIAAEVREENPVCRVEVEGWTPFWAITRHADVFEVSRRSDVFWNTEKSAPAPEIVYDLMAMLGFEPPRTLVHLHGEEHGKYRKITNDWFKPAAVRHLQPAIEKIADDYLDRLADFGGECDFAQDIAVPFTLHVIMSIFGVPPEDEPLMLRLTQGIFGAADPEYLGDYADPGEMFADTMATFQTYFDQITEARRQNPTSDLATVIANGEVDGRYLGETELLWYYIIIATAGHDTTSYALSGGLERLLALPDQMKALRENPDLIVNTAEEAIRWSSPVRSFLRWTQQDTEIGGTLIPKGDVVLTSYPSANRDAAVFERPMEFDITRPDADKHLAFGLGMHYCLGSQVARREVRTLLGKLMERTSSIESAGEPRWTPTSFVSGVKHLPIRYTLR